MRVKSLERSSGRKSTKQLRNEACRMELIELEDVEVLNHTHDFSRGVVNPVREYGVR